MSVFFSFFLLIFTVRQAFEAELRKSNQISIKARGTIRAFLNDVIPYLQGKHPLDSKVAALAQYKASVESGRKQATDTYNSFDELRERIKAFEGKCTSYTEIGVNEMKSTISSLQTRIDQLAHSFWNVNWGFVLLCTELEQSQTTHPFSEDIPQDFSRKKRELKVERNGFFDKIRKIKGQNADVVRNATRIQSHINSFAKLWRVIEDNVVAIESELEHAPVLFACGNFGLSGLRGQYTGLMEALELYTKALSEGDGGKSSLPQRIKEAFKFE